MNLLATAPTWAVWVLVLLLLAATIQDAVELKISNLISAAVLVLAIVVAVIEGPRIGAWRNLAGFAVVLAIGAVMFARGMFGGGDVKLFAAITLWTAGLSILRLVAAIFLCGGLLAILILAARVAVPESWRGHVRVLQRRAGIPYGIAITAGTLITIALQR